MDRIYKTYRVIINRCDRMTMTDLNSKIQSHYNDERYASSWTINCSTSERTYSRIPEIISSLFSIAATEIIHEAHHLAVTNSHQEKCDDRK